MTNRKIENELNIHFKITNNSFSLTTPKLEKSEEQIEHTISKYFPQSEFISRSEERRVGKECRL